MDSKKVISELVSNVANNVVKDVTIRNINTTEMTNYSRVAITLDKPVKGYIANVYFGKEAGKDGVPADANVTDAYVIGDVNVIFVSNFSLIATLREIPDVAFAGNSLLESPKRIGVILSGATINIVQEAVAEGQEYKNPFSDNATPTVVKHDSYYNHVFDIRLGAFGKQMVFELAKHIMFD